MIGASLQAALKATASQSDPRHNVDPFRKPQPLCGNLEGWGPISSIRYDFTPCFLDVWIATVAAWGLFVGLVALLYLFKKRQPMPVQKNWHFYTKLVGKSGYNEAKCWLTVILGDRCISGLNHCPPSLPTDRTISCRMGKGLSVLDHDPYPALAPRYICRPVS